MQPANKLSIIWGSRETSRETSTHKETRVRVSWQAEAARKTRQKPETALEKSLALRVEYEGRGKKERACNDLS